MKLIRLQKKIDEIEKEKKEVSLFCINKSRNKIITSYFDLVGY